MPALKSSSFLRNHRSVNSGQTLIVSTSPISRTPLSNINQSVVLINKPLSPLISGSFIKLKMAVSGQSQQSPTPLIPMSSEMLRCFVEKELLSKEDSDLNQPLILDCRPFLVHSESHIMGSITVHCPAILRRRTGASGQFLSLKTIIPDGIVREKLVTGQFSPIILYEHTGISGIGDSVALFVAKCIQEELGTGLTSTIHLLEDGFENFSKLYPHLCTKGLLGGQLVNPIGGGSSSYYNFPPVAGSSLARSPASGSLTWPLKSTPKGCTTPRTPKNSGQNSLSVESASSLLSFGNDQHEPVEILPHLYLGSENHASCKPVLDKIGITALLNVSHTCPNHFEQFYTYKCIPVEDSGVEDISIYFQEAIDYIENIRENRGKVLVHCHAGISRSATICMAYLMATRKLRMEEAYEFVKTRRRVVSPNFNFMGQLLNFESQVFPQGSSESPAPTCSSSLSRPDDEDDDDKSEEDDEQGKKMRMKKVDVSKSEVIGKEKLEN